MSTTLSRPQEISILGESWVVPSLPSLPEKERQNDGTETNNPDPRQQSETNKEDDSNTMDTSGSLISGPELIMPSICEEPILMPHVRSRQSSPSNSQTLKQRRIPSKKTVVDREDTPSEPPVKEKMRIPKKQVDNGSKWASGWTWERPIRAITNLLLIAAISHLLVVPEVVYHSRHLCTIPTIPALYPTSCSQLSHSGHYNHRPPPTRYDSVLSLQTQLEILFNSTLEEIKPYANSLPETESLLRDIQTAMKQVQSGPRHELSLEYDGCRQALTTATRKLDSLKADLRSAVDSLMATGGLPQDNQNHHHRVAKDVRLSTQMARREKYLDQLAARMRLKTDSLTGDFATVADHLESLKRIVAQQASLQFPHGDNGNGDRDESNVYKNVRSFVDSIVPGWRVPR
ncbi:uncharacterized protein ASPGLDRAFT_42873 [Aspergillus glaucus CBS 516.65]|uniref:Uncharacterized protein n=1 Tax=Aspergillus glaucus CBS 516.65 TaxID=1160497 RepID=A0A1L9VV75_ASPGL|nr:hypothetical protein ASPGLDRAFT_42873 [Aspergillus glaucus CBS 516.65]OJJ87805.1 hypothetical protein ASPGLDRAFT_42873 [Aspergillus glaucus CBS 516.65]